MAVGKSLKAGLSTVFCALLIAAQADAGSEGFIDLYLGTAGNWSADVNVSERTPSGTTSAAVSIDLTSSTEFGLRFGAWHPTYNWGGLAMDMGYCRFGAHAPAKEAVR